jgi:hypothetical protein
MSTAQLPDEGVVIIPRKIGFWTLVGGVVYVIVNVSGFISMYYGTKGEILSLERTSLESKARGDDIRRRLEVLERDRDRITRVEEQLKVTIEMLREIREEVRRRN